MHTVAYIYKYVCLYTATYVYKYVCLYACMCAFIYVSMYTLIYKCLDVNVSLSQLSGTLFLL